MSEKELGRRTQAGEETRLKSHTEPPSAVGVAPDWVLIDGALRAKNTGTETNVG